MSASPVVLRAGRTGGLTPAQLALWTAQRLHPGTPLQNMALRFEWRGPIDPERFVAAFATVVGASDALRTVFDDRAGTPRATVLPAPPGTTEVLDLPHRDVETWTTARVATPMQLDRSCYDSVLLRHAEDHWSWLLDIHHLVTDAYSHTLVHAATAAAYEGRPFDIAAAVTWRTRVEGLRDTSRWHRAVEHWRAEDAPTEPLLRDRADGERSTRADRLPVPLDPAQRDAIETLLDGPFRTFGRDGARFGLAATLLAAWLHRIADADELTIGVPLHLRDDAEARRVVGLCMELFPLRIQVDEGETFRSLHTKVQRGLMTVLRHAVPGTAPAQRFDVVCNVLAGEYGPFAGLPTSAHWVHPGHIDPHHRLRLQVTETAGPGSLELFLDVHHGAADEDLRRRMPGHLVAVLDAMLTDPDAPVGSFGLGSPAELETVAAFRASGPGAEPDETVPALLERALAADPARVVIEEGDRRLDAATFVAAVDGVARALRARGIGRGDRVGVRMPRSLDAVVAIHGILRSGASFVVLDPASPTARLEQQIAAAEVRLVLDTLPDPGALDTLPDPGALDDPGLDDPGLDDPGLDDEAYVLFTSGSTGVPKGVPIPHRGLAEYLRFAADAYVAPGHRPVVPLFTSLTFDLTITSLFLPFLTGGTLLVHTADGLPAIAEVASEGRADWVKCTPSHLDLLVRLLPPGHPLRVLVVGGEQFPTALATRAQTVAGPGLRIFNEYGPTEAVVGCMIHEFDPSRDAGPHVPVGRPAPGADVVLLDRYGHPVPPGLAGEMYLHRPGMTVGYLGGVDADRFVHHPAVAPHVLYRTGDVAHLDPATSSRPVTTMTYHGRRDEQLKVRGMRLEAGEVEAVLSSHPSVDRAVVRFWSPARRSAVARHCVRCGLADAVPAVTLDDEGVCSTCRAFDAVRDRTAEYFCDEADLRAARDRARAARRGDVDCLLLLSGGKDSSYALYRLVELGFEVATMTLDNGFISEEAKANVRRIVEDLGVEHRFVTTPHMSEVFRDSLERFSNVCNGCYKTIYTLGVNLAHELGAPMIVTGLSRGQLFETRLIPAQFADGRFDPAAIDAAVLEARKVYHRTDDAAARLLDTSLFADDAVFEEIEFLDFYRYEDVPLSTMLGFLAERAPWTRPSDTGRSTNCLINAAGIHTHLVERGFHNYAVPYAWDVRMGHKTRAEALEELDDELDEADVTRLLAAVGYEPRPPQLLTAWYTGTEVEPEALRSHAAARLPEHAVPVAFVHVPELPLTVNGKVAVDRLPAPTRFRRGDDGRTARPPTTPTEHVLCEIWSDTLGVDRVGVDEDFFALGGASLAALETIVRASAALGVVIPESAAFEHRTVAELAAFVDLLRADRRERQTEGGPTTTLPAPEGEPPLSDGQRALLYESDRRPDTAVYNITQRYRIRGPLDLERLRAAFLTVVARHEALHLTAGAPRRALSAEEALSFRVVTTSDTGLEELAEAEARTRVDLRDGPLVRVVAARIGDDDHGLVLTVHHLTADATSLAVIWRDLAALLAGSDLPEPGATFGAHAAWRAARLDPAQVEAAVEALDGAIPVGFPFARTHDRGVRPVRTPDGLVEHPAIVPARGLPGPEGRPFPALLAVFAGLLQHLTDQDEVLLGVTTSTRDHPGVVSSVGYFLDVLPLRMGLDPTRPVAELVADADRTLAAALDRRVVPYARIAAGVRRRGGPDPARVLLVLEEDHHPTVPGCTVEQRVVGNGTAAGDLTVFVRRTGGGFALSAEYAGDVLGPEDARAILDAYARLLQGAGDDPGAPFVTLPVTAGPDLAGPPLGPHPPTVTAAVLGHAHDTPDAPAVRCGGERRTYGELVRRATAIAHALAAAGVGRGDRVALLLPRSTDLVASVLAAHLLGAAEVPVDPTYPQERVDRILRLAVPAAVVVPRRADRPTDVAGTVVPLDEVGPPGADAPDLPGPDPDDPAYVIFTSGSTGTPRGVEVRHRQLAASTFARRTTYPTPPGRFLLVSSFGFDSSVAGLFWTLATGGELVVPTDTEVHDLDRLADLAERAAVTHLLAVPTLYGALLARRPAPTSLQLATVAGESCPPALVRLHHERSVGCRLANEYGPTETTVWATVAHLGPDTPPDAPVPIGDPVPGVVVRVADRWGRARPTGAAGELRIGGAGLTDGYLADPGATADRFPTDGDGRRWYRTGDLVRRRADGPLDFLGRLDGQLSIGGHRIEPEEVEAAILALPGVRAAVVRAEAVLERDPFDALRALPPDTAAHLLRTAADGTAPADRLLAGLAEAGAARTVLVAHVEGDGIDETAIRRSLGERLPRHLVPSHVRVSPALPRSPHGKLDRQAIPPIVTGRSGTSPAPPLPSVAGPAGGAGDAGDDVLGRMVAVWRTVLVDDEVEPDTDLFGIGGDSLTAVALVARIETDLGVHLPISALLGAPTPRRLAALVRRRDVTAPHVVELRTGLGLPLFLLPTGPGHLLGYAPLVQALPPDLPLYGFTAPGSDGRTEPLATVEEHARLFLDELVTIQPSGPYRLLGWSTGGLFAYELARLLRDAGQEVELVAMIDTLHPTAVGRVHAPPRERYRHLWAEGGVGRVAEQLADGARRRGTAAFRDLRIVAARAAGRPIDLLANDQRMVRATDRAVAAYRPEPLDAQVVLFAAGDTRPDLAAEPWAAVLPDLVVVELEGSHAGPRSITSGERVGELADHLRRRLR